ncbi:hypothetical protein ACFTAO_37590 [Paenibacillus rhizoplanae]
MSGRQGVGIKVTELVRLMEDMIESTRSDKKTACPAGSSPPLPSVTTCCASIWAPRLCSTSSRQWKSPATPAST